MEGAQSRKQRSDGAVMVQARSGAWKGMHGAGQCCWCDSEQHTANNVSSGVSAACEPTRQQLACRQPTTYYTPILPISCYYHNTALGRYCTTRLTSILACSLTHYRRADTMMASS